MNKSFKSNGVITQEEVDVITRQVIESLRRRTDELNNRFDVKFDYTFSYLLSQLNYYIENTDEQTEYIKFVLKYASLDDIVHAYMVVMMYE